MEFLTEAMALGRALDRAGLRQTARALAEIAMRPNVLEVKPLTRVRHCEHALRCWIRGEPGPHIERAIAELLVGALTLNPTATSCVKRVETGARGLARVGELVQNRS
jgi:hypothetical protein